MSEGAPMRKSIELRLLVFYDRGNANDIGSGIVRLCLKLINTVRLVATQRPPHRPL